MQDRGNKYDIRTPRSARDDRVTVRKHGNTLAVCVGFGDIHGEHGVFHEDTRFVSAWRLRLEDQCPLLLSSQLQDNDGTMTVNLTNPDMDLESGQHLARGTLHINRQKFLWNGSCHE